MLAPTGIRLTILGEAHPTIALTESTGGIH